MDLGRAMGAGRWGLIGGLMIVSGGFLFDLPGLAWGGVAVAVVALVINTAGKFAHYLRLAIPREQRMRVMVAWFFLVVTIAGLLVDYTYARATAGYEGNFWALVIATAGFAAVYWGLRTRYVPKGPAVEESK